VLLDRKTLHNASEGTMRLLKNIRPDVRMLVSQAPGEKPPAAAGGVAWIERPFDAVSLADAVRTALASQ